MKCLNRNLKKFYYKLYEGKERIYDTDGNETGEYRVVYSAPVMAEANISSAKGSAIAEDFGVSLNYDRVLITNDINCPIDEHSILFIDESIEDVLMDDNGQPILTDDNEPIVVTENEYNYIVKKVAKSLNTIAYAIAKVDVS